jgi:transketolase
MLYRGQILTLILRQFNAIILHLMSIDNVLGSVFGRFMHYIFNFVRLCCMATHPQHYLNFHWLLKLLYFT